jgi:hypothetical protein
LGKGCKLEENTCWDLYTAPGPPSFYLDPDNSRKGCANWESIMLQKPVQVRTRYDCAQLCVKFEAEGCSQFNFQPGPCAGDDRLLQGSCYLFAKGCQVENNTCWDLYTHIKFNDIEAYTTATAAAKKGATELAVASTTGFEAGETVTLLSGKWGTSQNLTVSEVSSAGRRLAAGTITFDEPGLLLKVEAGDYVLSINSFQETVPSGSEKEIETQMNFESDLDQDGVEDVARTAMADDLGVPKDDIEARASPKQSRMLMDGDPDGRQLATTTQGAQAGTTGQEVTTTPATTTGQRPFVIWVIIIKIRIREPRKASRCMSRCKAISKRPSIFAAVIVKAVKTCGFSDSAIKADTLVMSQPRVAIVVIVVGWNKQVAEVVAKIAAKKAAEIAKKQRQKEYDLNIMKLRADAKKPKPPPPSPPSPPPPAPEPPQTTTLAPDMGTSTTG